MVSNIAIADFCKVIEQESMGKPVFLNLMFKAFSLVAIYNVLGHLSQVSSRTSSHKLEIRQLNITALYY